MGKLIAVVGNTGVGKTTLTQVLCRAAPFVTGLEQHQERPFQAAFARDLQRYALANQVDYLLFRAEQERAIRESDRTGIQDGGLDLDFHVFTRQFFRRGYLDEAAYRLCERLYGMIRACLPPPDLILRMVASLDVVARRYTQRGRAVEIATREELAEIESLLDGWLEIAPSPILTVDASTDAYIAPGAIAALIERIEQPGIEIPG